MRIAAAMQTAIFTPPSPPEAPRRISALGVMLRLRRNAFSAFPARCFEAPVIKFPLIGRDLVLAGSPEAMRDVLATRPELYRRVRAGDRVFGPIVGRGLASSEGEAWKRQRRTLAPAFTPRTLPLRRATSRPAPRPVAFAWRHMPALHSTCSPRCRT